jgi:hypothetical protein
MNRWWLLLAPLFLVAPGAAAEQASGDAPQDAPWKISVLAHADGQGEIKPCT